MTTISNTTGLPPENARRVYITAPRRDHTPLHIESPGLTILPHQLQFTLRHHYNAEGGSPHHNPRRYRRRKPVPP